MNNKATALLRLHLRWTFGLGLTAARMVCAADSDGTNAAIPAAVAAPSSTWPMLLGAQYTLVDQNQSRLYSPYSGPLSRNPNGDTEATNTVGLYTGWAPVSWGNSTWTSKDSSVRVSRKLPAERPNRDCPSEHWQRSLPSAGIGGQLD